MNTDIELLTLEVDFWRRLIDRRRDTARTESLERMQQALEFAQWRLMSRLVETEQQETVH